MSIIFPATVGDRNLCNVSLGRYAGLISLLLAASLSLARAVQSVILAWDASPSSDVAGYKVYYGTTSGSASQSLDVGKVTTATVSNLAEATTYFFSVVAYNTLESLRSNEVSYRTLALQEIKYLLTVNFGTGGGPYPYAAVVPVSANPPGPGQQFAGWDGDRDILANFMSSNTTATIIRMDDLTISATYSSLPTYPVIAPSSGGTGLLGQYYNDSANAAYPLANPFTGSPVLTRTDAAVSFDWGRNAPASAVNVDNFSVKWTGLVKAPVSGSYTFTVTADDGVRLFLNGAKVIDGWKSESARIYSYTTTLTAGTLYNIELQYCEQGGVAVCRLQWSYPGQSTQDIPQSQLYASPQLQPDSSPQIQPSAGTAGTGLRGQYYDNSTVASYPLADPFTLSPVLTRTDAAVSFDWGRNAPASAVNVDNFSVKWTGLVKAPVSGSYTFTVTADDGVRLFLNGAKVIDGWKSESARIYSYTTTLTAGTLYDIELQYYEQGGVAVCRLQWNYPGQSTQDIPQSQLYPSSGQN